MLNTQSFLHRKTLIFIATFSLILLQACKNDDEPKADCSKVTGATFATNTGKVENLLKTKCGGPSCHAAGGNGAVHWVFSSDYDKVKATCTKKQLKKRRCRQPVPRRSRRRKSICFSAGKRLDFRSSCRLQVFHYFPVTPADGDGHAVHLYNFRRIGFNFV
jgi:hypothetical protein